MKIEFSIFVKKHLISSMAGFQSPITIAQAIERIHRNEYLLPAFQRDFVWSAEQIEKLFDSLMRIIGNVGIILNIIFLPGIYISIYPVNTHRRKVTGSSSFPLLIRTYPKKKIYLLTSLVKNGSV